MAAEVHSLIALHALFPRQALILRRIDAFPRPDQGLNVETRTGTNSCAHVVGVFWIDQDHRGTFNCGGRHLLKYCIEECKRSRRDQQANWLSSSKALKSE